MAFSRRTLLKLFLGIGLLLPFGALLRWFAPAERKVAAPWDGLRAFVDALVPADTTPGAVELGVVEKILAAAEQRAPHLKLLREGTAWLDEQARVRGATSFAALPREEIEAIVGLAAASPPRSLPRTFFQSTLDDALYLHYADPRSWEGLGYEGPPQPRGFPDHAEPPAARS